MKKFLVDIIGFASVFFAAFLLMGYINIRQIASDLFLQELHEKETLIDTCKDEPRVVFIGGSNLAFGLDSKFLSDSLNVSVLNLGLHAGLGLKLLCDIYLPYVREGDVVIISPEYGHFWGETAYGEPTTMGDLPFVNNSYEFFKKCNYKQVKNILTGFSQQNTKYFLKSVVQFVNGKESSSTYFQYSIRGFNEYGDETSHLVLEPVSVSFAGHRISKPFNDDFFCYFINEIHKLRTRGISVYLIPPATCYENYLMNEDLIMDLSNRMKENGILWLGDPGDFSYDNSLMYDTPYHLNKEGRIKNSEKILLLLKTSLQQYFDV